MSELNDAKSFVKPSPPPLPPPPPAPPQALPHPQKLSPKALSGNGSPQMKDENTLEFSLNAVLSTEQTFNKVYHMSNTYVEPQLQDGPKCGLVALSMATSLSQNFKSVDDIFQVALSLNFTNQGEMFSADFLAVLAVKFGFKATVLKGGLHPHVPLIMKRLLKKCLMLVPYDADFNHAPCCKRGLKAHWALITGFVVLVKTKPEDLGNSSGIADLENWKSGLPCGCTDRSADSRPPLSGSGDQGSPEALGGTLRSAGGAGLRGDWGDGKVYLIGRQGKSRHFGLWGLTEMAESNDNLVSVPGGAHSYRLPEGGIVEGLKGKAIILEHPEVS